MEHSFDKCSRLLLLLLRARSAAHLPGAEISTVQSHGQRRGEGNERERGEKGEDSYGTGAEPKTKPPNSCTLALLPSNLEADMGEKRQRGGKTNQMKIVRDLSGRPNLSAVPSVSLGLRQC